MNISMLHHVSIVTADLDRAIAFYRDVLGLRQIARPQLRTAGAWLASGTLELHLIHHPGGTFRQNPVIDTGDVHFAVRVPDFGAALGNLAAKGFHEDATEDDPKRIVVRRQSPVGYPQAYLVDPDRNMVEINAATL